MSDSYLTPYCDTGDIQAFPVTENLDYAQKLPNDVLNYWFHQLGVPFDATSAQTRSSLSTSSSVFGDVSPPVSPNLVTLYYLP